MNLGDMDWIAVAQDRDQWRALVNAVMKYRGIEPLAAPQELRFTNVSSYNMAAFSRRRSLCDSGVALL
jgi:hypothetical protein